MTYRERRMARADRLREWAAKREAKAAAVFKASEPFRGDIAFNTQPGHIPFRARLIAREDRAVESLDKAHSMEARADNIERQASEAIYSDDPDAADALRAKVAKLEATQAAMKAANAAIRKHAKAGADAQVAAMVALGFDEVRARKLLVPDFAGRIGFADFETKNNGANIRRLKARLAEVERVAVEGEPWRYYSAAKYGGTCDLCSQPVNVGDAIVYRRGSGEVRHFACHSKPAPAPEPAPTTPATEPTEPSTTTC